MAPSQENAPHGPEFDDGAPVRPAAAKLSPLKADRLRRKVAKVLGLKPGASVARIEHQVTELLARPTAQAALEAQRNGTAQAGNPVVQQLQALLQQLAPLRADAPIDLPEPLRAIRGK